MATAVFSRGVRVLSFAPATPRLSSTCAFSRIPSPVSRQPRQLFSTRYPLNFQKTAIMSKIHVPNVKLNNGLDMPLVGFGLWKVPNESAADIVYNAIKTGYRLFDGAADYGNEKECGEGFQRALKEGIVKREELFIVSKLWQTFHDPEQVEPIVKKQLADYGIDYFDLYIIHFPLALKYVDPKVRYPPGWFYDGKSEVQYSKSSLESTWHAMEDLTKSGLSKSIGVSNYTGALLLDLFAYAKILPATLQIEHHPYFVQPKIVELAQQNGVTVTGYSSFGPQSFVDGNMQAAAGIPTLFDHSVVKEIADAHGKTTAQVLLRWNTQRGIAVIPKSSSQGRLESNLDVCSFDLKKEEIDEISGLDQNLKFNKPSNWGVPIPLFD